MPRPQPVTGVPVPSYPTALVEDTIEVEIVDSGVGRYDPIKFGTKYSSVEHGAFAKDLPDHVLVADAAIDSTGTQRKRTWVSNRLDQDKYNFAVSYETNDTEFPTYTRTYILPREGYEPLELLAPDSYDPFAYLIGEQVLTDTDPPELRSVFLKVVRVFQTLPGPIAYSIEYPYGGNPECPRITTKQKDRHMSFPQDLGTKCPIENYTNAILVAQTIQQADFAGVDIINRIYDVIPKVILAQTGEVGLTEEDYGGQELYGYSIGYLNGEAAFPFIVWRFTIGIDDYYPNPDLSFCPIDGYEKLRLVSQEAKADEKQNKILRVERRYETLPGPLIHKVDYDNNDILFPIVTTAQRVAYNEYRAGLVASDYCSVAGYTNLVLFEQHLVPADFGVVREDQRIFELSPSNVLTTYDYDSTIDAIVETKRQKVPAGLVPIIVDSHILEYREKTVDKYRTIQIASKLLKLPDARVEFSTTPNWPFPTLLTGIAIAKTALVANRSEVIWFPNTLRPIQNVPAILRKTTTYHDSPPPSTTIFVLPTRNIIYRGISFELSISNVLNDAITMEVSYASDTKYGNLYEKATFSATNPSATQYYSVIGQYKTVGCDITLWRGRIWVKQITEVILV
jgi:hypothetical protein